MAVLEAAGAAPVIELGRGARHVVPRQVTRVDGGLRGEAIVGELLERGAQRRQHRKCVMFLMWVGL